MCLYYLIKHTKLKTDTQQYTHTHKHTHTHIHTYIYIYIYIWQLLCLNRQQPSQCSSPPSPHSQWHPNHVRGPEGDSSGRHLTSTMCHTYGRQSWVLKLVSLLPLPLPLCSLCLQQLFYCQFCLMRWTVGSVRLVIGYFSRKLFTLTTIKYIYTHIYIYCYIYYLFLWVLWHMDLCMLFNAKSIFI